MNVSEELAIDLAALHQRRQIALELLRIRLGGRVPLFCTGGMGCSTESEDPSFIRTTGRPPSQAAPRTLVAAQGGERVSGSSEPARKDAGPGQFVSELLSRQSAGPAVAKLRRGL